MTTTENVYDKAREVLRERGWTRNTVGRGFGPTCLVGAVGLATGAGGDEYTVYDAAEPYLGPVVDVLREQYPDLVEFSTPITTAYTWNDVKAESAEQVDLVLDKAARAWDEQHSGGTR